MSRSHDAQLCVVLLSPPVTSGARTLNAVRRAADVIGHQNLVVVNLFAVRTRSSGNIAELGADEEPWLEARPQLTSSILTTTDLLFAWGLLHHLGAARPAAQQQVGWLLDLAASIGHLSAWSVGHDVRHPSRWHQYTADRHDRTPGGTADERLRAVLLRRDLASYRT